MTSSQFAEIPSQNKVTSIDEDDVDVVCDSCRAKRTDFVATRRRAVRRMWYLSPLSKKADHPEHLSMPSREEFLTQVWNDVINAPMSGKWIDASIAAAERQPNAPFADVGPAMTRLLDSGANRRDLSLLVRAARYEAVFQTLYMLDDPGVDNDDVMMMHEELLTCDPSGKDGRPGSAP